VIRSSLASDAQGESDRAALVPIQARTKADSPPRARRPIPWQRANCAFIVSSLAPLCFHVVQEEVGASRLGVRGLL